MSVFVYSGAAKQLWFFHTIIPGGAFMEKTLIVHCTYSEDGKNVAEIIQESFRLFLQKELLGIAI